LADFGYTTIRLHDDFKGADFIAKHVGGEKLLKVQLKGRLTFDKKYRRPESEEDIYIAFREGGADGDGHWYMYPHDEVFEEITSRLGIIKGTDSWDEQDSYHIGSMTEDQRTILAPYRLVENASE